MIALLDTLGPAIGRASWQAAALAILVVLLLRCFGERLQPRWRFLLWGVVVARLLFVVTPSSPCSLFQLARWDSEAAAPPAVVSATDSKLAVIPHRAQEISPGGSPGVESPRVAASPRARQATSPATLPLAPGAAIPAAPARGDSLGAVFFVRVASAVWLVGCVLFGLKLLATALLLRRRLSASRPVTDAALLELLETTRRRLGLKRAPALFVTPECLSPCLVGTWHPRIVLPESLVTQAPAERIRHVLAHELVHLVRGDSWTNWLLLAARILHWFNPVAWWAVRQMQDEREAACDDAAFAALGEPDRSAYAATIVELAASLVPSSIAPGLIGLFSPTCRLKARVERLLRTPSVKTLRAPIAAGLLLGLALMGLTDAAPRARARAAAAPPIRPVASVPAHPEMPGGSSAVVLAPEDDCVVTGTVTDKATGKPAAGAVITARRIGESGGAVAKSAADGRFRLVVPEGRYDFLVEAKDRVCVAVTDRDCPEGETVELPPLTLLAGGFISGRVVDAATREVVPVTNGGEPVMLGLIGPSHPAGRNHPFRLAAVDETGHFTLRAAPGENFPYFVNLRGDRMCWDTQRQPAIVVKDGETTTYDMLITPEITPEERLRAARKLIGAMPRNPSDRTAQILIEFRKLNHTVDETELWCLLVYELWTIGRDAVPQLCDELDRTTEERMLRRLGFALRTIDDPRAVPALIRALPKSLLPSSSDYGLIVGDNELTEFMQANDLKPGVGGTHFDLGRPVREIIGALHKLTGHDLEDAELSSMALSEDPRRQVLQRRIYLRQARRWEAWWATHWKENTQDPAYKDVHLNVVDEPLPPVKALGKTARLEDEWIGVVLSPASEAGEHAWNAYDLDTGCRPTWPATIPRDESARHAKPLADWAAQAGVDLICTTQRSPDGTETYVLRAIGMKVREISPRDSRNLDRLIAAGKLPEGRPVDELLMHYDPQSRQLVPDANGAFLYITREGSMGVIETTDRVTRIAEPNGFAVGATPGVGFHKGVRFNLKAIIP